MEPRVTFSITLKKPEAAGTMTYISVPGEVLLKLSKRKRLPVNVEINGYQYRSTITPMGGEYCIPVRREIREAAGVTAGQRVAVTLQHDVEARKVELPEDLAEAFESDGAAEAAFAAMSYTHQREYVQWITGAKRPETRSKRVRETVERVIQRQRLKG